ncbi:MAG TPA: isochorismatase family protein [Actinomycetota bacterium]|jgi:nicotinamidase/pyrazinamidase|nr:isochorismatase family protein [Actinomycetota bacterium]
MSEYGAGTALIVVDVQNDFADPAGSLYVKGGENVVARVNNEIDAAHAAGAPVVYTQDWHPESTPHFAKDGGTWPVHCVGGSWGAEFHPNLKVDGPIVKKGTGGEDGYSGFSVRDPQTGEEAATELEHTLRSTNVENVVVVGLATDYCVKETALDAVSKGFGTTVLRAAVAAVDLEAGDGDRALSALQEAGARVE